MGGLTAPWLLFSRQGANGQGRRCWSRRWALRSPRPPTSASRPTITFPSVCGTTHPARTSGAASSPMRSALYNFMVVNFEFLHRCMDTQMFFFHGFYNHSLELRRISFVWYSFWHSKTPHFLDSISYCLTNGVLFSVHAGFHCVILTKKIPAKNEISGFKRDSYSFLQRDFLIFAFECPVSTRESPPEQGGESLVFGLCSLILAI